MPGETLKNLGYDVDIPDNNPVIKESIEQTIKDTKMELTELAGSLSDPETVEGLESKLEDKMTLDHVQKVLANSLAYMQNEGANMRMWELIENLGLGYVLCLQIKLKKLWFYDGPLDGVYRTTEQAKNNEYSPTMMAVNVFQHDYNAAYAPKDDEVAPQAWKGGLRRDGRAWPATLRVLVDEPMDGSGLVSRTTWTTLDEKGESGQNYAPDEMVVSPEWEPTAWWGSPIEIKPAWGSVLGTVETNTDARFLRFAPIGGGDAVMLTAVEGKEWQFRSKKNTTGEVYEIWMSATEPTKVEKLSVRADQQELKSYDIQNNTWSSEPFGKIIQEKILYPSSGDQYYVSLPEVTFDPETYEEHVTGNQIDKPLVVWQPLQLEGWDEVTFAQRSDHAGVYMTEYAQPTYVTVQVPKPDGETWETVDQKIVSSRLLVTFDEQGQKIGESEKKYTE